MTCKTNKMKRLLYISLLFVLSLLVGCHSTRIVCGTIIDQYGDSIAASILITEPISDTYIATFGTNNFSIEVPRTADSLVFESCCFGRQSFPITDHMTVQLSYMPGEERIVDEDGWTTATPCDIVGDIDGWWTRSYQTVYWRLPTDFDHYMSFCHRFYELEVISMGDSFLTSGSEQTLNYISSHELLIRRLFEQWCELEDREDINDRLCPTNRKELDRSYNSLLPVVIDSLDRFVYLPTHIEQINTYSDGTIDTTYISDLEHIRKQWQKAIYAEAKEKNYSHPGWHKLLHYYRFFPRKELLIDHCSGESIPWQQLGDTFMPLLRMAEMYPDAVEIHFGLYIPDEMLMKCPE